MLPRCPTITAPALLVKVCDSAAAVGGGGRREGEGTVTTTGSGSRGNLVAIGYTFNKRVEEKKARGLAKVIVHGSNGVCRRWGFVAVTKCQGSLVEQKG